jgi:transposase
MNMSKSMFCGCDIALENNTIWLMLDDGSQPVKLFNVENNQLGAEVLVERICSIAKEHCVSDILIGTEATSMYDWHLLEYLAESKLALEFNLKLYRFNAKWIKNFKKSLAPRGKTDPIDSFAIAERLRMGRLPKEYVPDTKYQPLRKLTRFRFHLMQQITREKDFFLANLFLKCSAYSSVKPFGSTFSATSLSVINDFFSVDELAAMPIEELTEFILEKGKSHFSKPGEIVDNLKRVARESYRLKPELAPTVNLILASTYNNIRCYKEQVKLVDKAIAENLKALKHTLESIPGIGPVYAAGILAEIGDVNRFPNDSALAQFTGLTWPKYQSGKFQAEEIRMSHTGNQYLRYYLVEAANSVKRCDATYKAFYEKKYSEATKHHHKRALVLTARKLVRLVWTLLTRQVLYQPGYCSFEDLSKIS